MFFVFLFALPFNHSTQSLLKPKATKTQTSFLFFFSSFFFFSVEFICERRGTLARHHMSRARDSNSNSNSNINSDIINVRERSHQTTIAFNHRSYYSILYRSIKSNQIKSKSVCVVLYVRAY
jgi:hypothetical protein